MYREYKTNPGVHARDWATSSCGVAEVYGVTDDMQPADIVKAINAACGKTSYPTVYQFLTCKAKERNIVEGLTLAGFVQVSGGESLLWIRVGLPCPETDVMWTGGKALEEYKKPSGY